MLASNEGASCRTMPNCGCAFGYSTSPPRGQLRPRRMWDTSRASSLVGLNEGTSDTASSDLEKLELDKKHHAAAIFKDSVR